MSNRGNPLRSVRRWLIAATSALPLLASLAAVARERDRVCGAVPLVPCALERLRDLYRAAATLSCDARMLPAVRERHRRIAAEIARDGDREQWLAEKIPQQASLLAACRLARSSAGPAAAEENACTELREGGHLLFQVAAADSRERLLADTESELGCRYDPVEDEPRPRFRRRPDRAPYFSYVPEFSYAPEPSGGFRRFPYCAPAFGRRPSRRLRPPPRRAPATRRVPSSSWRWGS